jgi:hypothetical protein
MTRPTPAACAALLLSGCLAASPAPAQDLTITNVRIIGPNVTEIESGSIAVRGGTVVVVDTRKP